MPWKWSAWFAQSRCRRPPQIEASRAAHSRLNVKRTPLEESTGNEGEQRNEILDWGTWWFIQFILLWTIAKQSAFTRSEANAVESASRTRCETAASRRMSAALLFSATWNASRRVCSDCHSVADLFPPASLVHHGFKCLTDIPARELHAARSNRLAAFIATQSIRVQMNKDRWYNIK